MREPRVARADRAAVRRHFAGQAGVYDSQTEWRRDPRLLHAINDLTPDTAGLIADLGAGTGLASSLLRGRGLRLLDVDISQEMLSQIAPRRLAVVADAESLPLQPASLDGCVMRQLLHYTDDDRTCGELARVIKRGGWLVAADVVVSDPRDLEWWYSVKRLTQPLRRRCYSVATHRSLFERHGFVVETERTLTIERRDDWDVFCARIDQATGAPMRHRLEELLTSAANGAVHFRLVRNKDWILYPQGWHVLRARRRSGP